MTPLRDPGESVNAPAGKPNPATAPIFVDETQKWNPSPGNLFGRYEPEFNDLNSDLGKAL
jgi:hypothetical protein